MIIVLHNMPCRTSKVSLTERLINHIECITYTCKIASKNRKQFQRRKSLINHCVPN